MHLPPITIKKNRLKLVLLLLLSYLFVLPIKAQDMNNFNYSHQHMLYVFDMSEVERIHETLPDVSRLDNLDSVEKKILLDICDQIILNLKMKNLSSIDYTDKLDLLYSANEFYKVNLRNESYQSKVYFKKSILTFFEKFRNNILENSINIVEYEQFYNLVIFYKANRIFTDIWYIKPFFSFSIDFLEKNQLLFPDWEFLSMMDSNDLYREVNAFYPRGLFKRLDSDPELENLIIIDFAFFYIDIKEKLNKLLASIDSQSGTAVDRHVATALIKHLLEQKDKKLVLAYNFGW